jgi:hypothetical protein
MAHNPLAREDLARDCIVTVLQAMDVYIDDANVQQKALVVLYNVCYRCEEAHEIVVEQGGRTATERVLSKFQGEVELRAVGLLESLQ